MTVLAMAFQAPCQFGQLRRDIAAAGIKQQKTAG
jgi:hypothetical protein